MIIPNVKENFIIQPDNINVFINSDENINIINQPDDEALLSSSKIR